MEKGILSFFAQKFFDKFIFGEIIDMSIVQNVENVQRPKFKVVPMKSLEENPNLALSITLNKELYLEDIGSYLSSKFENTGGEFMKKDMEILFNHDMIVKSRYEHLKDLDLVRYYFYHELHTKEWTQIILSKIYNGKL